MHPRPVRAPAGAQLVAHPANNVHRIDGADPELDAEAGLGSPRFSGSGQALTPRRSGSSLTRPSLLDRRSPAQRGGDRMGRSLGGSFGGSFSGSPSARPLFPGKRRAGGPPKPAAAAGAGAGGTAAAGAPAKPATRIELELVALGMGLRFVELSGGQQVPELQYCYCRGCACREWSTGACRQCGRCRGTTHTCCKLQPRSCELFRARCCMWQRSMAV